MVPTNLVTGDEAGCSVYMYVYSVHWDTDRLAVPMVSYLPILGYT